MNGQIRRLVVPLAALLAFATFAGSPAMGAVDLAAMFERAAAAEFSGDQVVTCSTPVGVRDGAARVAQKDGVVYISAGEEGTPAITAGAGSLAVTGPGGSVTAVEVAAATKPPTGYVGSASEVVTYLDRKADRVTLTTAGRPRVRLTFDHETGALLRSETLNTDGSIYCTTKMTSFVAGTPRVPATGEATAHQLASDPEFSETVFPDKLGSFKRLDVYGWNEGGEMAYYSDGYFAFAIFHVDARFSVASIADARQHEGKLGAYWRWFRPGTVTLVWESDEGGMALHGDLPVDMQSAVLAGLPAPARPNLLDRILAVFGL
ncbi:MAG: hypothetical protein ACT4OP_02385 [Actinomycetota bacterium]